MLSTESESLYSHLEKKSVSEILENINAEDKKIAESVEKALPQIEQLVQAILPNMQEGGRLFYIGAGTSGRLGILDASECPPTYGVSEDLVVGIIAGGDYAIRHAVENAEDDLNQAWLDLQKHHIGPLDAVVGIAASGGTPYVLGGLQKANDLGCVTGCVVCNANSIIAQIAHFPVEVVVGPEYVTGSTRMKSGTAQKMVLNMISTSLMIKLGRVVGNKMVDMQLTNAKLIQRATLMIQASTNYTHEQALQKLKEYGSVRKVLEQFKD